MVARLKLSLKHTKDSRNNLHVEKIAPFGSRYAIDSKLDVSQEKKRKDITMLELDRAINEAGMGKAAGEDDIPYEMIKTPG